MSQIQIIINKIYKRKILYCQKSVFDRGGGNKNQAKLYTGGGGNMNQAGFTHPLCRKNPDPYFHRGCGTNACLYLNKNIGYR